jgi:hypothetical protein
LYIIGPIGGILPNPITRHPGQSLIQGDRIEARPISVCLDFRFVMNLTASNLLTCAVLNPLLMMDGPVYTAGNTMTMSESLGSREPALLNAGGNVCAISEGATALVTTSSVLSVLLIAVDQYFAVVDPLRYRARVDKLKSGVLIASVWLVSAVFGLIAALNPSPRSLWLSCTTAILPDNSSSGEYAASSTMGSLVEPAFALFGNETEEETTLLDEIRSIRIHQRSFDPDNSSVMLPGLASSESITYGLIYVIVHSVFAYLLPFAGICWIYVSIYSAAHRNSERTRRTGSRPILASASFCEDPYGSIARPPHQAVDAFPEEFRRIPKISSLSSIDETSETAHSANQTSRRRSFSSSSDAAPSGPADENTIVFTVGLQPVKLSCEQQAGDSNNGDPSTTVETTEPKTDFLEDDRGISSSIEDVVKSELEDAEAEDRTRRSSCDYSIDEIGKSSGWIAGGSSDSESEDEERYGYFDALQVPGIVRKHADRRSSDYLLSLAGSESPLEESRRDTTGPRQDCTERRTNHQAREDENNSIVIKMTDPSRERTREENQSTNSESKRSRRSSRRSSRSGVLDGDPHAIVRNTAENGNPETSSCLLTPIVTITPAPGKPGTLHRVASVRSTSSYINSLKHRISNGSLFKYREETRAARISALVIVMGLICWSPYVLLNVMKNLPRYSDHEFPHKYDVLALSFLIVAAYASPLLFGYRSRRVKRELRKFFCFRRELSYKNNRSLMAKKVLKRRHSSTLSHLEMDHRYNIFNCVYGRSRWPKEKVQFVQVPDTALAVETCRSSFSSGASTQISSTSTEEC